MFAGMMETSNILSEEIKTDYEMIFENNKNYKEEDQKLFRKKCPNFKYYPPILPSAKRIIAIGDLHGDFDLTIRVLKLAKLIDNNYRWIGGDTVVVQVGDQLDNCRPFDKKCDEPDSTVTSEYSNDLTPEDIKVLDFFTKLSIDAEETGGKVISLLGNHELLNVMGNMNYVSYNDIQKFKNYKDPETQKVFDNPKEARIHAFKPGNKYATEMACTRLPAIIIGSFVFAHAGFVSHFMEQMNIKSRDELYKISYVMRKWLLNIIDQHNVVNILTKSQDSLFWDRVLGSIPPNMSNEHPKCKKYLKKALDIFEVKSMIIGHTPQSFSSKSGINKTCDDQLWRIDFGGSFGFNKFDYEYNKNGNIYKIRKAQVLEILNDNIINILSEE